MSGGWVGKNDEMIDQASKVKNDFWIFFISLPSFIFPNTGRVVLQKYCCKIRWENPGRRYHTV